MTTSYKISNKLQINKQLETLENDILCMYILCVDTISKSYSYLF